MLPVNGPGGGSGESDSAEAQKWKWYNHWGQVNVDAPPEHIQLNPR